MSRQVFYVFFGNCRLDLGPTTASEQRTVEQAGRQEAVHDSGAAHAIPHESPRSMTLPLVILAVFSVLLGFVGTPAWPWFQSYLEGRGAEFDFARLLHGGGLQLMLGSSVVVLLGLGLGWWFYGREPAERQDQPDPLERLPADAFAILRNKYWVDEIYEHSIVAWNNALGRACNWLDVWVWTGFVQLVSYIVLGLSWLNRVCDEFVVNLAFDKSCGNLRLGGKLFSRLQDGRVQRYLRVLGLAMVVLVLLLAWGWAK
jgi:NADH-quinone oxidoreductase subunit L